MASKSGGGRRKIGRGMKKPAHTRYVNENRRDRNKRRKVAKHFRDNPNDLVAKRFLR